jgi:hypothetical protein
LDPVNSFSKITRDRAVQKKLKQLYGTVYDIDPWVGGLAEDHIRGGSVGELIYAVLHDQFLSLRDGDSFFYTGDYELMHNPDVKAVVNLSHIKRSDIIELNTSIRRLPDDVFVVGRSPLDSIFDGIGDVFDHVGDFFGNFGGGNVGGGGHMPHVFNLPEPSSLLLALLGGGACLRRPKRSSELIG